jgi:hypothetical protein
MQFFVGLPRLIMSDLAEHLDLLKSIGGNHIRNTMSSRNDRDGMERLQRNIFGARASASRAKAAVEAARPSKGYLEVLIR